MFARFVKKEGTGPERNTISNLNHPLEKNKLNPLDARLLNAVNRGDVASVKNYLSRGADVNCHQFNRATPLAIAAERDNEVMAHVLLSESKVDINFQDMEGDTPLHIAVKSGQANVAKLLLRFGADVNSSDPMGRTPLHTAVFERNIEMAKCLIHNGAKVNATDTFGELPLHIALLYQPCPHTARLLMRNGSQPNARNIPGLGIINETALVGDEAILVKIVYMLVHQGASVNVYEPIGKRTPLHLAAFTNNVELAEYLLSVGADVNAQTRDGRTPLAAALCFRSWDVADVIERHMLAHKSAIKEEAEDDSDTDEKFYQGLIMISPWFYDDILKKLGKPSVNNAQGILHRLYIRTGVVMKWHDIAEAAGSKFAVGKRIVDSGSDVSTIRHNRRCKACNVL